MFIRIAGLPVEIQESYGLSPIGVGEAEGVFDQLSRIQPGVSLRILHKAPHLGEPRLTAPIILDLQIGLREVCLMLVHVFREFRLDSDGGLLPLQEDVKIWCVSPKARGALPLKVEALEWLSTKKAQLSDMAPKGPERIDRQGRRGVCRSELSIQLVPITLS